VTLPFVAGFLLLHLLEHSLGVHEPHDHEYGEHHHVPQVGWAAATTLSVHSFLDGVAIGLAFQAGTALGWAVAIAVIAHDFSDGLNTVALMLRHGSTERGARAMLAVDALAPLLGALSTLAFHLPAGVLGLYLAFFAGFLLYLATGDILPEAHARHPSRLTMLTTIAGVGFIGTVVAVS
jgi:zinc transporter, ZIP family